MANTTETKNGSKNAKPAALRSKDANGNPIWPAARVIDGYAYELQGTYANRDAADAAVAEIRSSGEGAAQAFSSGRPKLTPAGNVKGQATYFAHLAAVYMVPKGKIGTIEGDGVTWGERAPRVKAEKPAKAAKGTKTEDIKASIAARAARNDAKVRAKKAAEAEPDEDADEDDDEE